MHEVIYNDISHNFLFSNAPKYHNFRLFLCVKLIISAIFRKLFHCLGEGYSLDFCLVDLGGGVAHNPIPQPQLEPNVKQTSAKLMLEQSCIGTWESGSVTRGVGD